MADTQLAMRAVGSGALFLSLLLTLPSVAVNGVAWRASTRNAWPPSRVTATLSNVGP